LQSKDRDVNRSNPTSATLNTPGKSGLNKYVTEDIKSNKVIDDGTSTVGKKSTNQKKNLQLPKGNLVKNERMKTVIMKEKC